MINPIKLMDIFTAAVVAVGMFMGGAGLAIKHVFTVQEDKDLAAHCLPVQNDHIVENAQCSSEEITSSYEVYNRLDTAHNFALGGLFVILAGGMIGGTAGYARAYQNRMKNYLIK